MNPDNESLESLTKKSIERYKDMNREPSKPDSNFPKKGDKLKFKKVPAMYYPMFTNIGEYAKNHLIPEFEYTVAKVEVNSSWCAVWLEGIGDENNFFNYTFFYPIKP